MKSIEEIFSLGFPVSFNTQFNFEETPDKFEAITVRLNRSTARSI